MNNVFVRNFIIFAAILLICTGTLVYGLIKNDRALDKTDDLLEHTNEVIVEAEQLSTFIESMLSSQRGYLVTGQKTFLDQYWDNKQSVANHIYKLTVLTVDNASQQNRLGELRAYYNQFAQRLEARSETRDALMDKNMLDGVEEITGLRDLIISINSDILEEEYALLKGRIARVDARREEYLLQLLIGISFGAILILVFNGFLLQAQTKKNRAERSLQSSEQRFAMAIDGTNDGIFDWNIETGEVFYSGQFFGMLGYEKKSKTATTQDFEELLHPEDSQRVWGHAQQYLNGELSEYEQDFRLRHKSGRWVWIRARAKGVFGDGNKVTRLVGAHTDITSMVKIQEKLEIEKDHAEQANRAKSNFLAHMSHEIRTPLTAISGIAEILSKNMHDLDDKKKQLVKTLGSSSASLKELVNDVLDFSKIESGEVELNEKAFALESVFEETISMMALQANEKGVSFVFDYGPVKNLDFYGDPMRVRQILVNLIGNALKFTDKGGVSVTCGCEQREDMPFLRIEVTDTGIGIEPTDFDVIFESFKQADDSVSRKYGGTGLGLPISRQLAHLMGGDIFLSSQVGKGSTFTVILPMKIVDAGDVDGQVQPDMSKLHDKIRKSIGGRAKVLLVDDYEGNIVVVSYILEDIGLEYDIAKTGLEAVNLWKDNHYDIVLMDVQMPEMDGFTATAEIRRLEEEQKQDRTPIIGMTAHALVGDKNKCIESGMDSYLPKPLVEADITKQILRYLGQAQEAA